MLRYREYKSNRHRSIRLFEACSVSESRRELSIKNKMSEDAKLSSP